MAKKKTKTEEIEVKEISLADLKVGDVIWLDPKPGYSSDYTVLDVGNPFILIEDSTHFAYLYRVVRPIYKPLKTN